MMTTKGEVGKEIWEDYEAQEFNIQWHSKPETMAIENGNQWTTWKLIDRQMKDSALCS